MAVRARSAGPAQDIERPSNKTSYGQPCTYTRACSPGVPLCTWNWKVVCCHAVNLASVLLKVVGAIDELLQQDLVARVVATQAPRRRGGGSQKLGLLLRLAYALCACSSVLLEPSHSLV